MKNYAVTQLKQEKNEELLRRIAEQVPLGDAKRYFAAHPYSSREAFVRWYVEGGF